MILQTDAGLCTFLHSVQDGHFNHLVKITELYDSASGSWTATASLGPGRAYHTAILLLNGNVLGSGGISTHSVLAQAELYQSVL